jgi:hypothetical protein
MDKESIYFVLLCNSFFQVLNQLYAGHLLVYFNLLMTLCKADNKRAHNEKTHSYTDNCQW